MNKILQEFNSVPKLELDHLKALANPPRIVQDVLETVLILLKKDPTIKESRRLLAEPNLFCILNNFEISKVDESTLKQIQIYSRMEHFNYKTASEASKTIGILFKWVEEVVKQAESN